MSPTPQGAPRVGPADKAIIQARRLLLEAIKTVRAGGAPRGVSPTYYPLRAAEGVLPRDADWRQVLTPEMATAEILQTVQVGRVSAARGHRG